MLTFMSEALWGQLKIVEARSTSCYHPFFRKIFGTPRSGSADPDSVPSGNRPIHMVRGPNFIAGFVLRGRKPRRQETHVHNCSDSRNSVDFSRVVLGSVPVRNTVRLRFVPPPVPYLRRKKGTETGTENAEGLDLLRAMETTRRLETGDRTATPVSLKSEPLAGGIAAFHLGPEQGGALFSDAQNPDPGPKGHGTLSALVRES